MFGWLRGLLLGKPPASGSAAARASHLSVAVAGDVINSTIIISTQAEKLGRGIGQSQRSSGGGPDDEPATSIEAAQTAIGDNELRQMARALLDAARPPSLPLLFLDASDAAREALRALSAIERFVTNSSKPRIRAGVVELANREERHHLIVAGPGAGKTHALWCAAETMLGCDGPIPLLIPLAENCDWQDVLEAVAGVSGCMDPDALLRDSRICLMLDGWSQSGLGQMAQERARAMRVLQKSRLIATAKQVSDNDTQFCIWNLDALPVPAVLQAIRRGCGENPEPDAAFLEFLRLPLALSLYLLLGGGQSTRGELLARFHDHLARGLPEAFREILTGAVAATSLSGQRSYLRLENEVRDRARAASLPEPLKMLTTLGTLEDRNGKVRPVHDLYWSWLAGTGLLGENMVQNALPDLSTRESFQLAVESGAIVLPTFVDAVSGDDVVLASLLSVGLDRASAGNTNLDATLTAMFGDPRLPVRCRAAIAGLTHVHSQTLGEALKSISDIADAKLYIPALRDAVVLQRLYDSRGALTAWIGNSGSEVLIDAIAANGGPAWGGWLEMLAKSGTVEPAPLAAAALACEGRVPTWATSYLPKIVAECCWKLRPVAQRGNNAELAMLVAARYDEFVSHQGSQWLELNKILIACGSDEVFEILLSRFDSWSKKPQEVLGFAIGDMGHSWVGRFQRLAFRQPTTDRHTHHHKLAEMVSEDIDDATARSWISNGYFEPGWRALIARHNGAIVPEMIELLPPSFDGMLDVPILAVMRHVKQMPESVIPEILGRIRGVIQPKVLQDALNALAQVRPQGVPALIGWITANPFPLPDYHIEQFLRLLKAWEGETGLRIRARSGAEDVSFGEWMLVHRSAGTERDQIHWRALASEPDLAVRTLLGEYRDDIPTAKSILENLKPFATYRADLVDYLIARPDFIEFLPKLFAAAFDTFPEQVLLRAAEESGQSFDSLLRALAVSSSPAHLDLHKVMLQKTLGRGFDLFAYREIAKLLRPHRRAEVTAVLKTTIPQPTEQEIWLIREIESSRQELLIDEGATRYL